MRRINISFNDHLSVLPVACFSSCCSLGDIHARRIGLPAGKRTIVSDNFVYAIDALSDFDLFLTLENAQFGVRFIYARKLQPMMLAVNDVSVIADNKDNRHFDDPSSLDEF